MNRNLLTALLAVAVLAGALLAQPAQAADTYNADPAHSNITFAIGHSTVGIVAGRFNEFSGLISIDEADPAASSVAFTVNAASVDTAVAARDEHLRSADFFNVAQYPEITFTSSAVTPLDGGAYQVSGVLTLHGVARDVTVTVQHHGTVQDEKRGTVAGFSAKLVIKRSDYDMDFGLGGIGDEVTLSINTEAIKQQPPAN